MKKTRKNWKMKKIRLATAASKAMNTPPTRTRSRPLSLEGDYHNRYQDWHERSIVDAGIVRGCEVAKVVGSPVLHFYLLTPRGKRMTYFPFRGNRTEWTDSYN